MFDIFSNFDFGADCREEERNDSLQSNCEFVAFFLYTVRSMSSTVAGS